MPLDSHMLAQLLEMKSVPKSEVHLMALSYDSSWTAIFELSTEGVKIRLSANGDTPPAAVQALHDRWKVTHSSGVDAMKPSLLAAPDARVDDIEEL